MDCTIHSSPGSMYDADTKTFEVLSNFTLLILYRARCWALRPSLEILEFSDIRLTDHSLCQRHWRMRTPRPLSRPARKTSTVL